MEDGTELMLSSSIDVPVTVHAEELEEESVSFEDLQIILKGIRPILCINACLFLPRRPEILVWCAPEDSDSIHPALSETPSLVVCGLIPDESAPVLERLSPTAWAFEYNIEL